MLSLFDYFPLILITSLEIHKAKIRQANVHKLKLVIKSCKTYEQLVVAKRMFMQQVKAESISKKAIDYLDSVYAEKLTELAKGSTK